MWEQFPEKKQKHLEQRRLRRKLNPPKYEPIYSRNLHLLNRYGLTTEDYETLLERQKGLCCICEKSFHKNLYVDHNHLTGKVRGLLCARCNTGVGFYEKDGDVWSKIKEYVEKYND
jgi:hypothetical protein